MSRFLETLFFSTSWVILVFVLSFCIFERGSSSVNSDLAALEMHLQEQNALIALKEELQFHLKQRLASFEDPAWIELLLIKNLGLVPEKYHKYVLVEGEN